MTLPRLQIDTPETESWPKGDMDLDWDDLLSPEEDEDDEGDDFAKARTSVRTHLRGGVVVREYGRMFEAARPKALTAPQKARTGDRPSDRPAGPQKPTRAVSGDAGKFDAKGFRSKSLKERDAIADAPHSIPAYIASALPKRGKYSDDPTKAVGERLRELEDISEPKAILRAKGALEDLSASLQLVSKDKAAVKDLVLDATDALMAQEHEALGRTLGDHGVRHLVTDAEVGIDIMRKAGDGSPETRAVMLLAGIFHDTGYLTKPSQNFADQDHPHWSQQHYDANVRSKVDKVLGEDTGKELSRIIATHAMTHMDWSQGHARASAFRLADNLGLFHSDKLPGFAYYAPKNIGVLVKLGKGDLDVEAARGQIRSNLEAADLKPAVKKQLLKAADELNPKTPSFMLGMVGTKLDKISWKGDHPEVTLKRTKANAAIGNVLDLGQKQFAKFAKTYFGDDKKSVDLFTKRSYARFEKGGQTLMEMRMKEALQKAMLPPDFWSGGWQAQTLTKMLAEGWDVLSIGVAQSVRQTLESIAKTGALADVLSSIEAGDFTDAQARILRAVTDLTIDPADIRNSLYDAHDHGMRSTTIGVQKRAKDMGLRFDFDFKAVNEESVRWAAQHSADLVVEITNDQRNTLRALVDRSIVSGEPPAKLAKNIRQVVGLHSKWATAVQSYEQRLLRGGMTPDKARAAANRYADQLLRKRATNIARTETLRAQNEGQRALWKQLGSQGFLDPDLVRRKWLITGDEKLCPYCSTMVGEKAYAQIEGSFSTPKGPIYAPPMHPQCRCGQALEVPDILAYYERQGPRAESITPEPFMKAITPVRLHLRRGTVVQQYTQDRAPAKVSAFDRKAAENELRSHFPNARIDLGPDFPVTPEVARGFVKAARSVSRDFPETAKSIVGIEYVQSFNDPAVCARMVPSDRGATIQFNGDAIKDGMKRHMDSKYDSWGDDLQFAAERVLTHEFGHAVHEMVEARRAQAMFGGDKPRHADHNTEILKQPLLADHLNSWQTRRDAFHNTTTEPPLPSPYGLKNPGEFFAECFLAKRMGWSDRLGGTGYERWGARYERWAEHGMDPGEATALQEQRLGRMRMQKADSPGYPMDDDFEDSLVWGHPGDKLFDRQLAKAQGKVRGHLRQGVFVHEYMRFLPVANSTMKGPRGASEFDRSLRYEDFSPEDVAKFNKQWTTATTDDIHPGLSVADAKRNLGDVLHDAFRYNDDGSVKEGKVYQTDDGSLHRYDEDAKDWYQSAHDGIEKLSQKLDYDPEVLHGVVAVLSPGQNWNTNVELAGWFVEAARANPDLTDDKLARRVVSEHHLPVPHSYKEFAKAVGVARIGLDESLDTQGRQAALDQRIVGPKVRSFFNNLAHPQDAELGDVTIDNHMLNAAFGGLSDPGSGALFIDVGKAKVGQRMAKMIGVEKAGPQKAWYKEKGAGLLTQAGWEPQRPEGNRSLIPRNASIFTSGVSDGRAVGTLLPIAEAVRSVTSDWNAAHPEMLLKPHEAQAIIWSHWKTLHPFTQKREATSAAIDATARYYVDALGLKEKDR